MESPELKPAKVYQLSYAVDYEPGTTILKPILTKDTGSVNMYSLDKGESFESAVSPFDILIQVFEGVAEVNIGEKSYELIAGQILIIPAHSSHEMKANERFKMLLTVIKYGYEEVSI
ncbi:MAG: cupin domain-containing protein [Cytophagales bacterium]|nr:cupin domain-containing protein [Cytophagales bacterium]